jgi:hypothetical protein
MVALMANAKKGLSALQLKRDLKVAYKTAWYLSHRIRKAIGLIEAADEGKLSALFAVARWSAIAKTEMEGFCCPHDSTSSGPCDCDTRPIQAFANKLLGSTLGKA